MLCVHNLTCHGPGRQLLIPESQSYLWFPLVVLIKGKEGKNSLKPSEQFGINGLGRQLLLEKRSKELKLNRFCNTEQLLVRF